MTALTSATANLETRADWRSVKEVYGQFASILSKGERIPPEVAGTLATNLGRVLAFYEDQESLFISDLLELWSRIDDLKGTETERFRWLYYEKRLDQHSDYKYLPDKDKHPPDKEVRRLPRPFEAAVETCRRLTTVNNVRHAVANVETGAILGGSVSYGRFYNVAGAGAEFGGKPSDTDLLLVIQKYEDLGEVAARLRTVKGVDTESLELFIDRTKAFQRIRVGYPHCIFSHKLKLWSNGRDPFLFESEIPAQYFLSLHCFSLDDFDYLTLKDIPIIQADSEGVAFARELRDYRDSPSGSKGYAQRSFSGIPLGQHELEPIEVERGFVTRVQVCLVESDRFCPGLHQNLVLPQFEKRWESDSVRLYLRLLAFRWKILERLRFERTRRPFEKQEISLSHVRYFVFSPHIARRADRDSHV